MTSQNRDLLKRLQHMQRFVERACAERDLAYTEAAHWQQRYETEAHQRRLEQSRVTHSSDGPQPQETEMTESDDSQDELIALRKERDQLRLALEQEKEEHQKTRASLITALGDALQRKPS